MQWWCSATAAEWTWSWRAYPGVWILMALAAGLYWRALRNAGRSGPVGIRHPALFAIGLLTLWAMLDWPVGALGAGYLLSVHTVQYVVITLIAMPLLMLGIPASAWPARAEGAAGTVLHALAHPVLGLGIYAGMMAVTHVPVVTDTLMKTQSGSLAIDLAWLVGSFAMWWPVIAPAEYVRIPPAVQIGYLFAATIPPTIPAGFLVFADYPIYGLYELAPRVHGIAAGTDQKTAGVIMKGASDPLLWIAMAVTFFRWQRVEAEAERRAQSDSLQEHAS
jgi:cytochrome c oxidase assembly factor CtaG